MAGLYPECALVCVALLIGLFMQTHMRLAHDIFWQFWIARQLLGGAQLYADIWEVNPPLWFWSAMPVEWLAEQTGIAWSSLLITLVIALGAMSAWLVAELVALPRPRDRLGVLLLVFVMAIVLPLPYLGQREQLALMTSLPYTALIARRHAGRSVPLALAVGVAVLGAYGFALKHYFTLVPLLLELWLGLRLQRRWRPWRPELIVLAGLAVAYAALVQAFTPEFLSIMVPMVRTAYYAFDPSLFFVLVKPYVLFWAVAGLFLVLTRDEPLTETTPTTAALFPAMLVVATGFALAYFVQRKGWDYHSIPATGAMAIATGLRLLRFRRVLPAAAGAALLIGLVLCMYPARKHVVSYDPYLDRVPVGDAVFVATIDGSALWSPDRHKLIWVSRAYSLWMMPAIAQGELVGPNTPELRQLAAEVLTAISQDIRCNPPYLILLENMPAIDGKAGAFTYQDFLFRDAELRRFFADHYSVQPTTPRGIAYLRRAPVIREAGLHCRNIR